MIYAEDITTGQELPFGTWTVTGAEIVSFARAWDPQPIHIDPVAAKAGPFGEVIASGLHTLAIYQRLMLSAFGSELANKAGKEITMRMRRPVRPGMTLGGGIRVVDVRLRPERGDSLLTWHAHLVADDQVVFEVQGEAVVFMRPAV